MSHENGAQSASEKHPPGASQYGADGATVRLQKPLAQSALLAQEPQVAMPEEPLEPLEVLVDAVLPLEEPMVAVLPLPVVLEFEEVVAWPQAQVFWAVSQVKGAQSASRPQPPAKSQ